MNSLRSKTIRKNIRRLLILFIIALVLSGLTAFPIRFEIELLNILVGSESQMADLWPEMAAWIGLVHEAIVTTDTNYPFIAYGTDWLAFAHLVIAIAFIGPLHQPVKNIWVIEFGLIACVLVIPLALICGSIRSIPFFWRLIDCSFGIIGFLPLWFARKYIKELESINES